MIQDRIRRARMLKGMSLDEVAQRLGDITKQGVSKFELGDAIPNSTRILQLARLFGVKPEYFFRPDSVELAPLEFRKRARMPKKRQAQVAEQMREHLERYVALERCFESTEIGQQPVEPHRLTVNGPEDAELAAQTLRAQWKIGTDAVSHLAELLEEHGLKVMLINGPEDFDGACAATADQQHVLIALNGNRPGERIRFTAAHELGHWVMALPQDMPDKEQESCCHRFAGAFLYPRERVLMEFGEHKRSRVFAGELLNAKRRYAVSMQMVLRRLKDLGLLTEAGYKTAYFEFSAQGWRRQEPEPFLAEQPHRFESLVFRGLAEDLFTPSRAAEFLQMRLDQLEPALKIGMAETA